LANTREGRIVLWCEELKERGTGPVWTAWIINGIAREIAAMLLEDVQ
jgi:hypothetical protein